MTVRRRHAWPYRPDDPDPIRREPWMDWGACAETGDFGFFPDDDGKAGSYTDARRLCAGCVVRSECLEYAISKEWSDPDGSAYGLWGGLSANERIKLIQQRKKAAA